MPNSRKKERFADKGGNKKGKLEPLRPQISAGRKEPLRPRSERKIGNKITSLGQKTSDDIARLVHELEVNQIELEMQNEELRRTQKDLEENRRRYHDLFNFAPVGYLSLDKNGVILDVNQTGCQLLGVEKIDLLKKPFRLYISPECQDRFYSHRQQVIGMDTPQSCEITLVRKDGGKIEVLLKSIRTAGENDKHIFIHAAVIDIAGQMAAEKDLKLIIDSSPIIIFYKDKEGRFVRVNRAFAKAIGIPEEKFLGKTVFDLYSTQIAQAMTNDDHEVFRTGLPKINIVELYESAKGLRWVQTDKIPIFDENSNLSGMVGFARDITEHKQAEKALQLAHARFQCLVGANMIGVVIANAQGDIIEANDYYLEILGYTREDLLAGKVRWIEMTPPEWLPADEKALAELREHGVCTPYEKEYVRRDASRRAVFIANAMLPGPEAHILAIVQDITERKKIDQSRFEALSRFYGFAEASQYGMGMADQDGHIIYVNPTLVRMLGEKSENDCIGKHFPTAYYSKSMTLKLQEEVMPALMRDGHWHGELELLTVDGRRVPTDENYFVIRDEHGRLRYFADILTDITERKQAENTLLESEERYRGLFESSLEGIGLSKGNRVVDANPALLKIFGYETLEEFAKVPLLEHVAPESRSIIEDIKRKHESGEPLSNRFEYRIIRKDGETRDVEISIRYVWIGNIEYAQSTFQDITERKRADELLRTSEKKLFEYQKQLKKLAAQLALTEERERRRIARDLHDQVSQSLAIAKIKLDTMLASEKSPLSAKTLMETNDTIEKAIQNTRSLTFDLSYPILYELGFVAAVAEWLREQVQEKHAIAVNFEDDGQPKPLDDDVRVLLFRNVRELLINIIKHARADKVNVSITKTDDSIKVNVEDNGVGFNVDEITASRKGAFGLFSIRESIGELGGHFKIESKPGAGCKIVMTAPLKETTKPKEQ